MKVLVFVKATPNSEKGVPEPTPELARMFVEMGKFNEKLVKAGVMEEADGLKPSLFGKRIKFSDSGATQVIDGPFAETKELVAGYWIWNVKSMDEALHWAQQCPNPMPGEEGMLELRPTYSMEEFVDLAPKEEFAREKKLRKQVEKRKAAKQKASAGVARKAKRRPAPARRKK